MNKRLLGWLSWWSERRHIHRPELLRALFEDLKSQKPDHVAVTGDLTNISLELDKSVVRSSVIPSLKYSCSGSPLMLVKGSTTIEAP